MERCNTQLIRGLKAYMTKLTSLFTSRRSVEIYMTRLKRIENAYQNLAGGHAFAQGVIDCLKVGLGVLDVEQQACPADRVIDNLIAASGP